MEIYSLNNVLFIRKEITLTRSSLNFLWIFNDDFGVRVGTKGTLKAVTYELRYLQSCAFEYIFYKHSVLCQNDRQANQIIVEFFMDF